MIVGIPKEIKNNENRVSLTPAGAHELVQRGHTVYIQHTAGINSGFSDEEYEKVGARILPTIEDVYAIAEMIIKVKEPMNVNITWYVRANWYLHTSILPVTKN